MATTGCSIIVGTPYSFFFTATGGTAPLIWAIYSGTFPAGLSINGATGELAGTPTTAGTYSFVISITDANGDAVYIGCDLAPTIGDLLIVNCPCEE